MDIRVEVTGEDIATGVPEDSTACALALAIRRAVDFSPGRYFGSGVYVNQAEIIIFLPGPRRYARADAKVIPPRLRRFIRRFDANKTVRPLRLTFHIRGVEENDPCPGPAS